MSDAIHIFDRRLVRTHRERAARLPADLRAIDREIRTRLVERLDDIKRSFSRVLDLGCGDGAVTELLRESGRVPHVVSLDAAYGFRPAIVGEAEFLPFASSSFDLAISALTLHWCDDLPGALWQLRRVLKPDGLLLAAVWGGETLRELRWALIQAEIETATGASPRVSPFTDVRDAGALLQRAGFALPVVDSDILTVSYPDAMALMRDLRGMGETNAVAERRRSFTRRDTMLRAMQLYQERFGDADGRIPATFQILTLTGWAPDASQQKPLAPGSAKASLTEALTGGASFAKDPPPQD